MESVEHPHELEEDYVTEQNRNTNDPDLLSTTINAAATDENLNPPADEYIQATNRGPICQHRDKLQPLHQHHHYHPTRLYQLHLFQPPVMENAIVHDVQK